MERSLNAQCILLLPPLVTSATSREASVFSIFLLMMLPQSIDCSRSVHSAGEVDMHAACEADVHSSGVSLHGSPPMAKGSAATCRYDVVDDCVP